MGKRFFFYFLALFAASTAFAKDLPLSALSAFGFKSYAEPERILVEGPKRNGQAIFLLHSPYALVNDQFVSLENAPYEKLGEIFLTRDAILDLSEFLEKKERLHLLASAELTPQVRSTPKPTPKPTAIPAPLPQPSIVPEIPSTAALINEVSPATTAPCDTKKLRVFLDPGHGGNDFGTRLKGLNEKDIVLQFALLAADELKKEGFEITFSRTKDVYLPLDVRSDLAKAWKADLFISIHINSAPAKKAHGTETYILSTDSTDAEARKLALLENAIPQSAKSAGSAVQDILWDMEQTNYLQQSAYLAADIQKELVQSAHTEVGTQAAQWDWKNRGVRQAPFFVLSRAPMPAVLVELGYLTNAKDRQFLTDKKFQESLAKALAKGVKQYRDSCGQR